MLLAEPAALLAFTDAAEAAAAVPGADDADDTAAADAWHPSAIDRCMASAMSGSKTEAADDDDDEDKEDDETVIWGAEEE